MLCGISDIFPWQIIWELLKVFWTSSTCLSQQKCENPKFTYFYRIRVDFTLIMFQFGVILDFSVWYYHEVLCEISDIFLRQTIWDLLKVFWRSSVSLSKQKCGNLKFIDFLYILAKNYYNVRIYWAIFQISVFGTSTRCSAGSKIFFFDK